VKKGPKNDLHLGRNFYRCNVLKQTLDLMTSAGIDLRTYLLVLQSAVTVSLDNFRKALSIRL